MTRYDRLREEVKSVADGSYFSLDIDEETFCITSIYLDGSFNYTQLAKLSKLLERDTNCDAYEVLKG